MPREVLFEIITIGEAVKVSALDPESGQEVCIQAPARTPLADLKRLAARKLERKLFLQLPASR